MKNSKEFASSLTIAEKIKQLRVSKGISQMKLAMAIGSNQPTIVRIEKGQAEYSPEKLELAKKELDIEGMPLTDAERALFFNRLYIVRDLTRARRVSEARNKLKGMAKLVNLEPCDYDLAMLYRLIEIQLLMIEGDFKTADKMFSHPSICPDNMNEENQYCYHSYKGYYELSHDRYETSLSHLHKALEIVEDDDRFSPDDLYRLYLNIAVCYSNLEYPYCAILSALKAKGMCNENALSDFSLYLNRILSRNYIKVDRLAEAKKLLDKCIVQAESLSDTLLIGLTTYDYGCLNIEKAEWKMAETHFDKAMSYFKEGSANYYMAFFYKIHSVIFAREFPKAKKMIEHAKEKYSSDKVWAQYFENVNYYLRLAQRPSLSDNAELTGYLENVAIPCFFENNDYFLSSKYCQLLKNHYDKIGSQMRSLLMTELMYKIQSRCLIGPEGGISP